MRSQLGTGIGNCGPACAAMFVSYDGISITVQQARSIIGYAREDGATSFAEIYRILDYYQVPYYKLQALSEYSGEGILLIALDMEYITNRPYDYNAGHYIILYGIIDDYYLVADPLANSPQRYLIDEVREAQKYDMIYYPGDGF